LALAQRDGGIEGIFEYRPRLFRAQAVGHLVEAFVALVEKVAGEPDVAVLALATEPAGSRGPAATGPRPERAAAAPAEGAAPRNETEKVLLEMFTELIGAKVAQRGGFGIHDDFFRVGGYSLLAMVFLGRVRDTWGVELAVQTFFQTPTVAELAALIDQARGEEARRPLGPVAGVARREPLALSYAQERLWFLAQLEAESTAYNIGAALCIRGALDAKRLRRAIQGVVHRHEALRTTFEAVDGVPVQKIHPPRPWHLPVVDLTCAPGTSRHEAARQWARNQVERAIDLQVGPLLWTALLRLDDDEHILVAVLHHIISDGWSMAVLLREIEALYQTHGDESPLRALPIQYADYAQWQRSEEHRDKLEQDLRYWRERLAGVASLELTTDRPRPPVQTFEGATLDMPLSLELLQRIELFGADHGATAFMTLGSALFAVLQRHSGQTDICIGSPIANRQHKITEDLIGFFVNTVVIRADVDAALGFDALLAQVRETCLAAYAHQDLPFARLVQELRPERDLSRSPVFQVMLVIHNEPLRLPRIPDLSVEEFPIPVRTAKFDLVVSVQMLERGALVSWEYSTSLFDAGTIERMAQHWVQFLEHAIAAPRAPVGRIPMMDVREREAILRDAAGPARPETLPGVSEEGPAAPSLHGLVEARAALAPNAIAVMHNGEAVTYRELDRRATGVAGSLRAHGVVRGDIVAIAADRSIEMVVAQLGVLKAGAAFLPIDPSYPAERVRFMIEDARPRIALVGAAAARSLPDGVPQVAVAGIPAAVEPVPGRAASPVDLAYVMYTSGSTGRPKGVMVPHGAVCNEQRSSVTRYPLHPGDRVLQRASPSFDTSLSEIYPPLIAGATLVIGDEYTPYDPVEIFAAIADRAITTMTVVPTVLRHLLDDRFDSVRVRLGRLHVVGERLATELASRAAARFGCEIVNGYGPTETAIEISNHIFEPGTKTASVPIGTPIHGVQFYVLDPAGEPVPRGMRGELYVGGAALAHGYLGRPGRTAESFVPDPFSQVAGARLYKTGDHVRHLPDGTLEFLGRIDGQVKLRGIRLELGEIEAALLRCPGVRQAAAAVRPVPNRGGDEDLVGYVVLDEGAQLGAARTALQAELSSAVRPFAVLALASLPTTSSGKLDRAALPAPRATDLAQPSREGGPLSESERLIAAVWMDVLGVETVARDDHFFQLGGHSLLATQVVARLHRLAGADLSVRDVFERPTLAGLAARLDQAGRRARAASASGHPRLESTHMTMSRIDEMDEQQLDALLEQLGDDTLDDPAARFSGGRQ